MTRARVFLVGSAVAGLAWMSCAPSFAARAIQGAVGQVTVADGAALGVVGFRVWSGLEGGETNVNDNTVSCRNVRCIRSYVTNTTLDPGGYVGNQEATQVYNGDLPDQPYYELVDASMNDATSNHIGFYGVAGVKANNSSSNYFIHPNCGGEIASACFRRIDLDDAGPILTNTVASYGAGPHQIRPISGLNPIPVPGVFVSGSCPAGQVCLSWTDPPIYAGNMQPSSTGPAPPSPVKGVRLYRLASDAVTEDCVAPAGDDPRWAPIGDFGLGQTTAQDTLPPLGTCYFYALTVRLLGPGSGANEIETYRVGANSQAVGSFVPIRVTRFDVSYTGHGVVSAHWQTGLEAGILGFYLTRSLATTGPFERVGVFVPAEGDSHTYAATDRVQGAARTYVYRLEILGRDGSVETSAPAAVTVPERIRRSGPRVR